MHYVKCYICGVTALSLVTLSSIPIILYVPSVSHERYLQSVACWDSALMKPPQQVSVQVFSSARVLWDVPLILAWRAAEVLFFFYWGLPVNAVCPVCS